MLSLHASTCEQNCVGMGYIPSVTTYPDYFSKLHYCDVIGSRVAKMRILNQKHLSSQEETRGVQLMSNE